MKFYTGGWGCKRNKWLDFGSDLNHHADCPIGNPSVTQQIMSEFWLNFQDSSAMIQVTIDNIFGLICITMLTVQIRNLANVGAMSCLGQGDLRSLSALAQINLVTSAPNLLNFLNWSNLVSLIRWCTFNVKELHIPSLCTALVSYIVAIHT